MSKMDLFNNMGDSSEENSIVVSTDSLGIEKDQSASVNGYNSVKFKDLKELLEFIRQQDTPWVRIQNNWSVESELIKLNFVELSNEDLNWLVLNHDDRIKYRKYLWHLLSYVLLSGSDEALDKFVEWGITPREMPEDIKDIFLGEGVLWRVFSLSIRTKSIERLIIALTNIKKYNGNFNETNSSDVFATDYLFTDVLREHRDGLINIIGYKNINVFSVFKSGDVELLQKFLEEGAETTYIGPYNRSVLHKIFELFDGCIYQTGPINRVPLDSSIEMIKLLVKYGADPYLGDKRERTIIDLTRTDSQRALLKALNLSE